MGAVMSERDRAMVRCESANCRYPNCMCLDMVPGQRKVNVIDLDRARAAREAAAMPLPVLLQATGHLTGPYRRESFTLRQRLGRLQRRVRMWVLHQQARHLLWRANRQPLLTPAGWFYVSYAAFLAACLLAPHLLA